MVYIRKTVDEFEIQSNYTGKNWDLECTESSFKDAKATLKTYFLECPGQAFRIVKRRIKKTNS